ncbi:MAG: ATP-binding protein [Salinivirgaceae bacterium]|nr:ATP-binding protein [Salinivirgaceae bacterium]
MEKKVIIEPTAFQQTAVNTKPAATKQKAETTFSIGQIMEREPSATRNAPAPVKASIRRKLLEIGYDEPHLYDALLIKYRNIMAERWGDTFTISANVSRTINVVARWFTSEAAIKPNLYVVGAVGTGKTTLARAIAGTIGTISAAQLQTLRISGSYIAATQLREYHADGRLDEFKYRDLMVLDDMGSEEMAIIKDYGNDINLFADIIFTRYDRALPTIITSNLSMPDLAARYGTTEAGRDRLADRLRETCYLLAMNEAFRTENAKVKIV